MFGEVRLTLTWILFFATTIYGHLGLKLAVLRSTSLSGQLLSFPGWSAIAAWSASALLWIAILSQQTLSMSNALSTLRYPLIGIAAWWVFDEQLTLPDLLGMALMLAGLIVLKSDV